MYLVTQGKGRINQLGYDQKTSEYVYFKMGKEMWREKGDISLLDYFTEKRGIGCFIDDNEIALLPTHNIWERYIKSCCEF